MNFSDQTATQLRNAGAMRLIGNRNVSGAISNYWNGITQVQRIEESLDRFIDEISTFGDSVLNRDNYLYSSKSDSLTHLIEVSVNPNATLMTTERNTLLNYANKIMRLKRRIETFYFSNLNRQKERTVS